MFFKLILIYIFIFVLIFIFSFKISNANDYSNDYSKIFGDKNSKDFTYFLNLVKSKDNKNYTNSINVLKYAVILDNKIYFIGYYDINYPTGPIDYYKLLIEALKYPNPALSIDPINEKEQLNIIDNVLTKEIKKINEDSDYGVKKITDIFINSLKDERTKIVLEKNLSNIDINNKDFIDILVKYIDFQKGNIKFNNVDEAYSFYAGVLCKLYPVIFDKMEYDLNLGYAIATHWMFYKASEFQDPNSSAYLISLINLLNINQEYENLRFKYIQKRNLTKEDEANFSKELTILIYKKYFEYFKIPYNQQQELINQALSISQNKTYLDDTYLAEFLRTKELEVIKDFMFQKILNFFYIPNINLYFSIPKIPVQVNINNLSRDTEIYKIMFLADIGLKYLEFSSNLKEFLEFAFYKNYLEYLPANGSIGYTILPKNLKAYKLSENLFEFEKSELYIDVFLRYIPTQENNSAFNVVMQEYEKYLNDNIDLLTKEYPNMYRLSELQKVLIIAKYLKKKNINNIVLGNIDSSSDNTVIIDTKKENIISIPVNFERNCSGLIFEDKKDDNKVKFFVNIGGVDFSNSNFNFYYQKDKIQELKQNLAISLSLIDKSINELKNGNIENARSLAELSFKDLLSSTDKADINSLTIDSNKIPEDKLPEAIIVFNELTKKIKDPNITNEYTLNLVNFWNDYKKKLYTSQKYDINKLANIFNLKKFNLKQQEIEYKINIDLLKVANEKAFIEAKETKETIGSQQNQKIDNVFYKIKNWYKEEIKSTFIDILSKETKLPLDKINKVLNIRELINENVVNPVLNLLEETKDAIGDDEKMMEIIEKTEKINTQAEEKIKKEARDSIIQATIDSSPAGNFLSKFWTSSNKSKEILDENKNKENKEK